MIIEEPVPGDTRSRNADFLELLALTSSRNLASEASLISALRITEDRAAQQERDFDPDTGEVLDQQILEQEREQLIVTTFEELAYREKCLQGSYPFLVDAGQGILKYQGPESVEHLGKCIYLFCLISTAIREKRFQPIASLKGLEQTIGRCFQICACVAAGEFVAGQDAGHVSSFGFPRALGTAFLPALRSAYKRFGVGRVRDEIPEGLPQELKDGGVDVIAWRTLPDLLPGRLYMLGQCASGTNWRSKSVVEYVEQLHGGWFTFIPAKFSIPAMFIPFPFHHDLSEPKSATFSESVHNRSWFEEQRFGIIFDRLRIPFLAEACMARADIAHSNVDGTSRVGEIRQWVTKAVQTATS
jgi:hypothetical protein